MGIVNYYRKFINRCADKPEELLKFLRNNVPFIWGEKEQIAFETLKGELLKPSVLRQPDFSKEFILDTDASNTGLGAVLSQKFADGEYPIIFLSRRLRDAELNYSISEKEMLAALWAMEQLHYYLFGRRFILRTDHKALLAFNVKGEVKSRRIERWYFRLQTYTFDVVYRKGEEQGNADALSRNFSCLNSIKTEVFKEEDEREIIRNTHKYLIHRGAKATLSELNKQGLYKIKFSLIKDELSKCIKCKQFRPRNYPGVKFNDAFEIGEKVAIDLLGPIQGHYIIAAVDYFSRKGFAMVIESRESLKIINFLNKISSTIQIKTLISDNAKEFLSDKIKKWCLDRRIKHHLTSPYHHQANGKVERFIRTIREGLQLYDGKGTLKIKLNRVLDVYNSLEHSGIGMSPNEALESKNWDILKKTQYEERVRKYKKFAKIIKQKAYKEGDEVLVQEDVIIDKQDPKYLMGGKITRILGNDAYEVLINGRYMKRYASQIRGI